MITVKANKRHLTVTGHAGYAPYGQDIVCAMVSCLLWTFVKACEPDEIDYSMASGDASITIKKDSHDLGVRMNMLMTGLLDIASEYPGFLVVEH